MKKIKILYWIFTGLFAATMFMSAVPDIFSNPIAVKGMHGDLGYPLYFIPFIGIAKALGVIAILVPGYPKIKEWAYAGLFFVMTGAFISHLASGDHSIKGLIGPFMQTIFIILSWYFRPASRKIVMAKAANN